MSIPLKKLNRFTTVPFLIDLLKREKLSLINPALWEDFNDRQTVEMYRKAVGAGSIYALCMSSESETIHHWNAFASGTSGCCIEFEAGGLIRLLDRAGIKHGKTRYVRVRDLKTYDCTIEVLPFVKREPYEPENEYRLLKVSDEEQKATYDISIDLSLIRKITISNKMPPTVYESLVDVMGQIAPRLSVKYHQSTLYNNERWIRHFATLAAGEVKKLVSKQGNSNG